MEIQDFYLSKERIEKLLEEGYDPGKTAPSEKMGLPPVVMQLYFQAAKSYLDDKQWVEARDAFRFLTFLNPFVHWSWVCLGIANQSLEKYEDALQAYAMAEATQPDDPVPYANAFQCAKAVNNEELADYSMKEAIKHCADKDEFSELKTSLEQLAAL